MSPPSEQKDIIDEKQPEDLILSLDLDDEERFEAISQELANKNARSILKAVMKGRNNTSTLIAESTGPTIQDVIQHLNRLEEFGLVETYGLDTFSSLRGRTAKRYRISKVGVLLIPSRPEDEPRIKEQLARKSAAILRKRFFACIAASLAWGVAFVAFILQSEVQHLGAHIGPPGSNSTSVTPTPPIQILEHLSLEIWFVILGVAIVSSIAVYFLSRVLVKEIIRW
jgi:DNA-binding transcriptional ArsR family regulator